MEKHNELDDFIRKSVKEVGLDSPSSNFTDSVLSKIQIENQVEAVPNNKPLLSKTTWFLILSGFALIFGYVLLGDGNVDTSETWLAVTKLNKLASFNASLNVPDFSFSATVIYGIVAIALFVWIQVFLMRKHLFRASFNA